jgi:hypothetical protein
MKRRIVTAILLAAALCGGAPTLSAGGRDEFVANDATLIEKAAAQLFPGSRLEWEPRLALVEGTTRRNVRIGGFDRRNDAGGGYTCAVAFELIDERLAIAAAIDKFEAAPSRSPAEIAVFKVNASLTITELRRASLADPASAMEQVEDISLSALTYTSPWPDVYVTYTGVYGTTDFRGDITWETKLVFDPAPASVFGRVPSVLSRVDKDSPVERSDRAEVGVVDENTVSFASGSSHHVISNCADPCLPDGRVLLGLWWTAPR